MYFYSNTVTRKVGRVNEILLSNTVSLQVQVHDLMCKWEFLAWQEDVSFCRCLFLSLENKRFLESVDKTSCFCVHYLMYFVVIFDILMGFFLCFCRNPSASFFFLEQLKLLHLNSCKVTQWPRERCINC